MNIKKVFVFLKVASLIFFITSVQSAWAGVFASVDRSQIAMGETVQLQISMDSQQAALPDLSSLDKDFIVLSTTRSEEVKIINGKADAQQQWLLILTPKHRGEIKIPGIHMGKLTTAPLTVTVMPAKQLSQEAQGDVFLTTEVKPQQAYEQSQFIYTVRVYAAAQVDGVTLIPPEADNATVLRLGKENIFSARHKGRDYRVLEQRYAIFPQRAGELNIRPPVFMGRKFSRINPQHMGLGQQEVRLVGQSQTLRVLPMPAEYKDDVWLPAGKVTLEETWSDDKKEWRAGEPLTRTIVITAEGLPAEQLPSLQPAEMSNMQIYPDKEDTQNAVRDQWVIGRRVAKIAYIPNQAGTVTLPAIKIKWWDRFTNTAQIAQLPAREIKILPALANNDVASNQSSQPAMQATTQTPRATLVAARNLPIWQIVSAIVIAAWLLTLFFFWRYKKKSTENFQRKESKRDLKANVSHQTVLKKMKATCRANKAIETAQLFLHWSRLRWPHAQLHGVTQAAHYFDNPDMSDALHELDRALYADKQSTWDGQRFWQLLHASLQQHGKVKKTMSQDKLPDL